MLRTLLGIVMLFAAPAWAEDGSIEQMDEYSKQRRTAAEEEQKLTPGEHTDHDYQSTILSDPITSPKARAVILHTQDEPDETETLKSTGTNRVTIKQRGPKNSSRIIQQGESNTLFIDQVGKENSVQKSQIGHSNSARIRVNGKLIEDSEEQHDEK